MASLVSITYTPRYNGCHRILFRTSEPDYCFYLDESPSVIGIPKTVELYLDDYSDCLVTIGAPISCDNGIIVSGYIQPCCSDINSNQNRVLFNTIFPTPTPCSSYTVECVDPVDCGKFTVPNCNGEDDGTEYELRSDLGSVSFTRVCSDLGAGPVGIGYIISQDAESICCTCKLYNIIVSSDIDVYYTDCNQTIDIITVQADALGVTLCAIPDGVWPVNKTDNDFIVSITETGDCIPND